MGACDKVTFVAVGAVSGAKVIGPIQSLYTKFVVTMEALSLPLTPKRMNLFTSATVGLIVLPKANTSTGMAIVLVLAPLLLVADCQLNVEPNIVFSIPVPPLKV